MKKLLMLFAAVMLISSCGKETFFVLTEKKDLKNSIEAFDLQQNILFCGSEDLNARHSEIYQRYKERIDARKMLVAADNTELIIYLSFDQYLLEGSVWNWLGPIPCPDAGLSEMQKDLIMLSVQEDFKPFKIRITRNKAKYDAAHPSRRWIIIISRNLGAALQTNPIGGLTFIGSTFWTDFSPGFVFSDWLKYNTKNIAEAVSHEIGHGLGLPHHFTYNANCQKIAEYDTGQGTGKLGWAAIMGMGYYKNVVTWGEDRCTGLNAYEFIASKVGLRADDCSAVFKDAKLIPFGETTGILESPTDEDMVLVQLGVRYFYSTSLALTSLKKQWGYRKPFPLYGTLPGSVTVSVSSGGNTDIAVDVYDDSKKIIQTLDASDDIHVPATVIQRSKLSRIYFKIRMSSIPSTIQKNGSCGGYTIKIE